MAGKAYEGRLAYDPDTDMHTEVVLGKPYGGEILYDRDSKGLVSDKGEPLVTNDGGQTWRTADRPGDPVVTPDGGKTWVYATEDDPSHHERYHERYAGVDGTANRAMELRLEHGRVKSEEMMREEQPHHFKPTDDDPHYAEGARDPATGTVTHTQLRHDPDHVAAVVTGHTDAYKDVGE